MKTFKVRNKEINCPFFMPVLTKATGKGITTDDYKNLGNNIRADAVICNALLMSLRPGTKYIKKAGGIHDFMNFDGVVFTDCGGFQVSSNFFIKKTRNGLHFKDPFQGGRVIITPESIMQTQHDIGSDVAMMLDDMAPYGATHKEAKQALKNTNKWGLRSLKKHKELEKKNPTGQKIFGIVQGNFFPKLRIESAKFLTQHDFDGFAIGGVAIGEPSKKLYEAVENVLPYLPNNKPVYVMGVGSPEDVKKLSKLGVDCFDSIYPTQVGRRNTLFTEEGKIYIDKGRQRDKLEPVSKTCNCKVCQNYTRAYLYHLSKIKDPVGDRFKSIHNSYYLQKMMKELQHARTKTI